MAEGSVRMNLEIGPDTPPLSAIEGIRAGLMGIESSLRRSVAEARRTGHSWQEIADALGVSRQSAWERFKDLDEDPEAVVSRVLGSVRPSKDGPTLEEIRAQERRNEADIERRRYGR